MSVRLRGDALSGFGTVVFFDDLQVDIGGGVIESAAIDAEELGELGKFEGFQMLSLKLITKNFCIKQAPLQRFTNLSVK